MGCQYGWTVYGLVGSGVRAYLEGAAEAEDAVVGLLGREALDGLEDDVGLFWDQVVGSVGRLSAFASPWLTSTVSGGGVGIGIGISMSLPQPELSVAGGIGVPVGEGGEPPLEEGALEHEGREGWLRHDGSRWGLNAFAVESRRRLRRRRRGLAMARAKESFRMDFGSSPNIAKRRFLWWCTVGVCGVLL